MPIDNRWAFFVSGHFDRASAAPKAGIIRYSGTVISLAAIELVRNHLMGRLEAERKPKAQQPVLVSGNRATEFKEWLSK